MGRWVKCWTNALLVMVVSASNVAHADDEEKPQPKPQELPAVEVIGISDDIAVLPAVVIEAAQRDRAFKFNSLFSLPPMPVEEVRLEQVNDAGKCDELRGNPVKLPSGMKVEHEIDFVSDGEMGLFLKRSYGPGDGVMFGPRWRSNFEFSLELADPTTGIRAVRPDGSILWLAPAGASVWKESADKPLPRLVKGADHVYTLYTESGGSEVYYGNGLVQVVLNAQGVGWYYTYSSHHLQQITHTCGRSVKFAWTDGRVTQVTDPAGNVYRYTYSWVGSRHRLESAVLPGTPTTTVSYHYQPSPQPGQPLGELTGKSYNGVRYSTFAYQAFGQPARAISTEHAGGVEKFQFAYDGNTIVETNPRGHRTTRVYADGKLVSVTGEPTAHCPRRHRELTYTAKGQTDLVHDFAGKVTDFDHDVVGRIIRKIEGAGTSAARTRTWAWDSEHNRITRETLVGVSDTAYTYAGNGRIGSVATTDVVSGQKQTTTYAYTSHSNGMLATTTVDGPLPGDTVVYMYSAAGDLLQVRNTAGHATTYSGHNPLGQPARVTSATGAVTEYEYDARGRTVVERRFPNGAAAETRYVYGASGLLDAMQSADGNTTIYHYDAARRLAQEDVTEPNGSYAVRRYTYNAMSQPIKVEIGRDP